MDAIKAARRTTIKAVDDVVATSTRNKAATLRSTLRKNKQLKRLVLELKTKGVFVVIMVDVLTLLTLSI